MPRIQLAIFRTDHPPALALGRRITATRLIASVSLGTKIGWTEFDPAVIDTGAPVSVFPPAIWRHADFVSAGRVRIGGLSRRTECLIPALLARVRCRLSDGRSSLGPISMPAYLAEHDDAPTLVGMQGFIEQGVLRIELAKDLAFLRFP